MVIRPEQDRPRRLEFRLTHIKVIAFGRAAPVDPARIVFLRMAPVLPEGLAPARTPPSRRADMRRLRGCRLEVQPRQLPGKAFGFGAKISGNVHFSASSAHASAAEIRAAASSATGFSNRIK